MSSICRNSTLIEINSDCCRCCCESNTARTSDSEYLLLNECCVGENRNELTLNRSFTLAQNPNCKLEARVEEIRESDEDSIIINENSITYNYLYEPDENDTECRRIEIIDDDSDMSNSIIISDHRCRRHLFDCSTSSSLVNDCNKHYYENEITINNTQSKHRGDDEKEFDYDDDDATITTSTTTTTKKSAAFDDVQVYFTFFFLFC